MEEKRPNLEAVLSIFRGVTRENLTITPETRKEFERAFRAYMPVEELIKLEGFKSVWESIEQFRSPTQYVN